MSQKTGIGIFFLAAAMIAALILFYMAFAEPSIEDNAYLNLLEKEEVIEDIQETKEPIEEAEGNSNKNEEPTKQIICAFVCGKVKNVGIYELLEGARLSDFISAAGGFSKQAAKEYLNLAEKAEDGQRIYVPSKKEAKRLKRKTENGSMATGDFNSSDKQASQDGKVNINTAKKEELMTLTGIGEAKADAIINYREEKGAFHTIEELMQIPGIKEGIYNQLCNDITI